MKRFKYIIANIISAFFPGSKTRKNVRRIIFAFQLKDIYFYRAYKKTAIREKSILIIEPNNFHDECIPGYIKYFVDSGYQNIDVICKGRPGSPAWCNLNYPQLRFYRASYAVLELMLKSKNLADYDYVFLNSEFYCESQKPVPVLSLACGAKTRLADLNNVLLVSHEITNISTFGDAGLLLKNRVLTLGEMPQGLMVNPHYYGEIKPHSKNKKTKFLIIGAIKNKFRNYEKLLAATEALSGLEADFEISVVGPGNHCPIPEAAERFYKLKGELDFKAMYDEIESADFILPMLDPEIQDHHLYITCKISGIFPLIYGFAKPGLVQEKFAGFYSLTGKNSIIYSDDLEGAMLRAIEMSPEEYSEKQLQLKISANEIYRRSLKNLQRAMAGE